VDWHWVLLDVRGRPMDAPLVMAQDQRFPSQSDAESWIGEQWPELRLAGVDAVTLREGDRVVYGPMRLVPGP
jgi:hypothetical protein